MRTFVAKIYVPLCYYYESINHEILLDKLSVYIKDKIVLNLLTQYLKRSVGSGGLFT
ncbi:MAG: RNA-directed DNA polymerase, partial [Cognaticolwellia sp.]